MITFTMTTLFCSNAFTSCYILKLEVVEHPIYSSSGINNVVEVLIVTQHTKGDAVVALICFYTCKNILRYPQNYLPVLTSYNIASIFNNTQ